MRWPHIVSALFRNGGPSGIVINTGPFEHIGFAIFAIETAGALVRGVLLRRLIIQAAGAERVTAGGRGGDVTRAGIPPRGSALGIAGPCRRGAIAESW